MNNDGIIWEVLNNQFCSFKVKTDLGNLCRHQYNLTGRCNRNECPLANSKYATVREWRGSIYLCMKTAERAHTPADQWERIALPKNFAQAAEAIDEHMLYWPDWMIHTCKQRLTKITQYLIRMRKFKLKNKHTLVPIKKKLERRERSREIRAEAAARLDQSIEKELLERLRSKAYGDQPLNVNESVWKEILEGDAIEAESDVTTEDELEDDEEYEQEFDADGNRVGTEFVADDSDGDMEDMMGMPEASFSSDESDEDEDDEDDEEDEDEDQAGDASDASSDGGKPAKGKRPANAPARPKPAKRTKKYGPRVEIEYETEPATKDAMLTNW